MRIVIDMQGAQTESRFRGIGRYTMSFAQAVVRNRGKHEIILALNGLFPDTIEPIRAAFDGLLPQENIRVWQAPGPVREEIPGNERRREVAEFIREAFLASLEPDVIHITSLFEGFVDDAVTSIARFDCSTPVSVSLYDLIPLINPDHYLKPNPLFAEYYQRKIAHLKQAAIYLAISEFSRQEGVEYLGVGESRCVNVSTAIEPSFQPLQITENAAAQLRQKFGLIRSFVLYTGGADERKNLPRLIQAYAALPESVRAAHQLLFAGKMPEGNVASFKQVAKDAGLQPDELCFTGYVSDEELVQLYNLCQLYVFPSWHEGFGLPALEAMACGAPVIGANTSSLPEVIGLEDALFDPLDVTSVSTKMAEALSSETFRTTLREHGLQQAKKFSWDETAKRAIAAWEELQACEISQTDYLEKSESGTRLLQSVAQQLQAPDKAAMLFLAACIAQNQQAGIERQLLLDISELSQRDAATGVQRVVRSYLKWLLQSPPAGFRIEPVYATLSGGYRYARRYTQRFLGQQEEGVVDEPMQWQRGDIFFGLDMQHHVQLAHAAFFKQLRLDGVTTKFLVHDLLPIQLADYFKDSNAGELHEGWLRMIAATDGAICVSKATADALDEWLTSSAVAQVPTFQIAWVHNGADIDASRPSHDLPSDVATVLSAIRARPSFLTVATLEPRKGQEQILDAVQILWNAGIDINLVLVGQQGWKTEALAEKIRSHAEHGKRLFWLQGISDEYLDQVYAASTCLIAASINEGFGLPLIEAARHHIPIVARDIPVFREVAGDCAFYFSGNLPSDLAGALEAWLELYRVKRHPESKQINWSTWRESTEKLKKALVEENYRRRQLLVDISELVQLDARTGIQRVVRSILREWLTHPPAGYCVEPVFVTAEHGYRYARRFTSSFIDKQDDALQDEPIVYAPGDVFFGLDLQPQVAATQRAFYQELRRQGVRVLFAVYDLLSVRIPQYFPHGASEGFARWLDVVAEGDGAVCISEAVADDLASWLAENSTARHRSFKIDWFHLGADVNNLVPTHSLPDGAADSVLDQLQSRISFLMVGTLEPRKGHEQVLKAFEQLWQSGHDVSLVIVGKEGWMVKSLVEHLHAHSELNNRLFWLNGVSDESLEKIYATTTCLIAASYGEGFGLPLIEAAQHKLAIFARDIPVFREVAGEHAYYFDAQTPDMLAQAVKAWIELFENQKHPRSDDMPWLTWKESARRLAEVILPKGTADADL